MTYDVTLVEIEEHLGALVNNHAGFANILDRMLVSFWICTPNRTGSLVDTCNMLLGWGGGLVEVSQNGVLWVSLTDNRITGGSNIYSAHFSVPFNARSHVLISIDCPLQIVQVYVNDASVLPDAGWTAHGSMTGFGGVNIDTASLDSLSYPGLADVWMMSPSEFVDLSNVSNRRKFINRNLTPVYLGTTGLEPFGSQPPVYLTVPGGGVPTNFANNYGFGGAFTIGSGVTLRFQIAGSCPLPTPPAISSGNGGAIGDVWMDDSFVDFNDPTIRNKFQNPDGTWRWLGQYGQFAGSPLDYLTVQFSNPPSDILTGYGQSGDQSPWALIDLGIDPTTGLPYAPMSFDLCLENFQSGLMMPDFQVIEFPPDQPLIHLRYSDDAGGSWSNKLEEYLGREGEFSNNVQWNRLGTARFRVFEISWSVPTLTALTGIWIDAGIAQS